MNVTLGFLTLFAFFALPSFANAHCQIPCGLYDDENVFRELELDLRNIEKSMNEIIKLAGNAKTEQNQTVRWVQNKELHADHFAGKLQKYFSAQRIKLVETKDKEQFDILVSKLVLLHRMTVYAMKSKQTTDLKNLEALRENFELFRDLYSKHHH